MDLGKVTTKVCHGSGLYTHFIYTCSTAK